MENLENGHKDGHSLVWDEKGEFREQKWTQLKQRIEKTQGGIGIAADDFLEMLRYRSGPFGPKANTMRDAFADLTRDATESEDIDLLSDILVYMLRYPWSANQEGGWFIYYLEEKDSCDIDLPRAALVLNRLHDKHPYAAEVLCKTLSFFVYDKDQELVIDLILKTGRLSSYIIDSLKGIKLNPPCVGVRELISYPHLFISYSRLDTELMRKVMSEMRSEGFKTWSDEKIEPGAPDWVEAIRNAIKDCGALVVILTPRSYTSQWVRRELDYASEFEKRVFPIHADGDEDTAVPVDLKKIQRVDIQTDFHSGLSTLAAAVRRYIVLQERTARDAAK